MGKIRLSIAGIGRQMLFAFALLAVAYQVMGGGGERAPAAPAPQPVRPEPSVSQAIATPVPAPAPVDDGLVVKRILDIREPLDHGDWFWDDKDVPAGRLVITIDLAAQTVSVFRGGYEIGTAVILYGADEKPTPLGAFPILEKDADHVSNLYQAPMPYMLRLTNDGVAIHASDVAWGAATHGCIGVPTRFAELLFAEAKIGDTVLITRGKFLHVKDAGPAV